MRRRGQWRSRRASAADDRHGVRRGKRWTRREVIAGAASLAAGGLSACNPPVTAPTSTTGPPALAAICAGSRPLCGLQCLDRGLSGPQLAVTEALCDRQPPPAGATAPSPRLERSAPGVMVAPLPGSPAERAGIQERDIVVAIDARAVLSSKELWTAVNAHKPGDRIAIRLVRSGSATTRARDLVVLVTLSAGE